MPDCESDQSAVCQCAQGVGPRVVVCLKGGSEGETGWFESVHPGPNHQMISGKITLIYQIDFFLVKDFVTLNEDQHVSCEKKKLGHPCKQVKEMV